MNSVSACESSGAQRKYKITNICQRHRKNFFVNWGESNTCRLIVGLMVLGGENDGNKWHNLKHGLDSWTGLVDWTRVLDSWTGLVDWTDGLDSWTGLVDWIFVK